MWLLCVLCPPMRRRHVLRRDRHGRKLFAAERPEFIMSLHMHLFSETGVWNSHLIRLSLHKSGLDVRKN